MRHVARHVPRKIPCPRSASIAYWLQVGEKRHEGGFKGEITRR